MWMYEKYFLPSIRFILTVHDVTKSDLTRLDAICNRYIKKWSGVPKSGTNLVFKMSEGLGMHTIASLYEETHCLNHAAMRMKGDPIVNAALDIAIAREEQFQRKGSTVCRAENIYMQSLNMSCQGGEFPIFPDHTWDREKSKLTKQVKVSVKLNVHKSLQSNNQEHLDTLMKQGDFFKFAQSEGQDPTWKSFIWNLPVGTAKFILNSTIHTLPTQKNLKLWNKSLWQQRLHTPHIKCMQDFIRSKEIHLEI